MHLIKFTFKRNVPTGRYRSFFKTDTDIKVKGKICGSITQKDNGKWTVSMQIKDAKEKIGWRWVFFSFAYLTEELARERINDPKWQEGFFSRYTLHFIER